MKKNEWIKDIRFSYRIDTNVSTGENFKCMGCYTSLNDEKKWSCTTESYPGKNFFICESCFNKLKTKGIVNNGEVCVKKFLTGSLLGRNDISTFESHVLLDANLLLIDTALKVFVDGLHNGKNLKSIKR